MKRTSLVVCLLLLSWIRGSGQCNCSGGVSYTPGQDNPGAVTLKHGEFQAESSSELRNSFLQTTNLNNTSEVSRKNTSRTVTGSIALRYGLLPAVTITAFLPHAWIKTGDKNYSGFGDAMFLSAFRLFDHTGWSAAIIAGIKIPTGNLNNLAGELPLAAVTGTYDPVTGGVISHQYGRFVTRAVLFYKHATPGKNKVVLGNFWNPGVTVNYRLARTETSSCSAEDSTGIEPRRCFVSLLAGLNFEFLQKQTSGNIINPDSGGSWLFLKTGISLSAGNFSFPVSAELPLVQKPNGIQYVNSFRIKGGISFLF